MDRETRRVIEEYRRNEAGPLENNVIDELVNGELNREEFLKRGAMFGMSLGIMGSLLAFTGEAGAATTARTQRVAAKAGGTIRVGLTAPGASLEPYLLNDGGALALAGIPGEYLTFTNPKGVCVPWLATSWKPNKTATVWTFQIRKGVKFHDGKPMTADDVVATFKVLTGPKSAAASVYKGILSPSGVVKTGPYTVQFRLDQPTGGFPYLVSQTTYQAPILPKSYVPGTYVQ